MASFLAIGRCSRSGGWRRQAIKSGSGPRLAIRVVAASVSGLGVGRDLVSGGCALRIIRVPVAGMRWTTPWSSARPCHPGRLCPEADAGPAVVAELTPHATS